MNKLKMLILLTAALGLILGCAREPQGASTETMIAAANALDEAFVAAFNQGDAGALASLYWDSPDVVSFPPGEMQARGLAAIKASNERLFQALPGARLELTEKHQMRAGDVVIAWGLWRVTTPAPDGTTSEVTGRFTDVKAERNGKWVYLLDHASAPLPPPPPSESSKSGK